MTEYILTTLAETNNALAVMGVCTSLIGIALLMHIRKEARHAHGLSRK